MFIPPGTEVLHVNITGLRMNQAHIAAHLHPPGPGPEVKRTSPGPTAQLESSIQPRALTMSLLDDRRPAPTLDPCPGHALALGPGLDASLEATKLSFLPKPLISLRKFLCSF